MVICSVISNGGEWRLSPMLTSGIRGIRLLQSRESIQTYFAVLKTED